MALLFELAGGQLFLAKPGKICIVYQPEGGEVTLSELTAKMQFRWFDPLTGDFQSEGTTSSTQQKFISESNKPIVLIVRESKK